MVFAQEHATAGLAAVRWGKEVVPQVREYKYLGVVLSDNCGWGAHVQYVLDKANKTIHALGAVLHNKRVSTAVRRVVLQAVLRPVVEYGSPVWQPSVAELAKLEQVQTRVLRRLVACGRNVADDVLRMELACRPYASWFAQRKLEYAYRLLGMGDDRLPRMISGATWPQRRGAGAARMHADLVRGVATTVGLDLAALHTQGASKGVFKGAASVAVRKLDMTRIRGKRQSTVARYLEYSGAGAEFPTQLAEYLSGPMAIGQRALLLCRAGALLPRQAQQPAACPHCGGAHSVTLAHVMLDCTAWAAERATMWAQVAGVAGASMVRRVQGLQPEQQLHELLGTPAAGLVTVRVQSFLAAVYVSMRAPRHTARAALASVQDIACQVCHNRGRAASLLLCDGCSRGYHLRCLEPALPAVPAGTWLCPSCIRAGQPSQHIPRRERREGPWPSGYG